jgi:hypothetical protein
VRPGRLPEQKEGRDVGCKAAVNQQPVQAAGGRRKRASRGKRRQALVTSGNRTLPGRFQIGQEEAHQIGRYIDQGQPVHRLMQLVGDERNQQNQSIAVTTLRVSRQVALGR